MEHARPPPELNMEGGPVSRADAWKRWKQQFQLFVKASGVSTEAAGVQASLLVNLIGPEGFDVYQTFSFDTESEKDDVNVIIKKFDAYFGTKVNITLLRYKFYTRDQEEGESIQAYVTALRLLSNNCKFGSLQDELLKDRIVCGVRNTTVRDRLLRSDDLDLDKAVKICQAEEVSRESGKQLSVAGQCSDSVQVHAVERRTRGVVDGARAGHGGGGGGARAAARECAGCGGAGARCAGRECPAQYVTCFSCGNKGHFARMCKLRFVNGDYGVRKVYEIEENVASRSDSDENETFFMDMVSCATASGNSQWSVTLLCKNGSEQFKLDTGADINVMSFEKFVLLGFDTNKLQTSQIHLQSFTGDVIPIKGVCDLVWWYENKPYNLYFAVANIKCQSVLGRHSCEDIGLICRESSNTPASEPLMPVEIPKEPWEEVGSDIIEIGKKYFLTVVDYYSNYVEVCNLPNIKSKIVISHMKEIFSRRGIPKTVHSYNGTQYSSREFQMFAREWGFNHVTSSLSFPKANGKSERAVQTVKSLLEEAIHSNGDFYLAILNYRNTPRNGVSSPTQLLMGPELRRSLPVQPELLTPRPVNPSEHSIKLRNHMIAKKLFDKRTHGKQSPRQRAGDDMMYVDGKTRTRATVVGTATTPRSHIIKNKSGGRFRRNHHYLMNCETSVAVSSNSNKCMDDGKSSRTHATKYVGHRVTEQPKFEPNVSDAKIQEDKDPSFPMTRRRANFNQNVFKVNLFQN